MKQNKPHPTPPALPTSEVATPAPENVIVRGIGIFLPDTLRSSAEKKAVKLLRHHQRIVRIRIDLSHAHAKHCTEPAVASGRIELGGPDLVATVASASLGNSLDLLIDKLDRMLRERTKARVNRRNDRPDGLDFRDTVPRES